MKSFEIYSKPGCPYCDKAKELLTARGYSYNDVTLDGQNVTKATIQDRVNSVTEGVTVSTVPQIILKNSDGTEKYIGGYTELRRSIDSL